ncbi:MAG: hypothetical protein JSR60_04630 [Proteobacteria bacterium]|nr:hypothetical protein [Pseudomonadota bacterium]
MPAHAQPGLHREARTVGRFFLEAAGAVALLAASTIYAHNARLSPGTDLYTAVQLMPVIPVWLLLLSFLRHYLRIDELQRLMFLQSIALTAGLIVGIAWSWPAIRRAFGLQPELPGMWEIYFSVLFVAVSAFMTKIRTPR